MNTRNMILSGLLAVTVLMIMSTNLVYASDYPGSALAVGDPHVYLLKKDFAICGQYDSAMPPSDQQYGCLSRFEFNATYERVNEYAFTGERIAELVAVRQVQGAELIQRAEMVVGDDTRVLCNDVTNRADVKSGHWDPFNPNPQANIGLDIHQEKLDMPPSYTTGSTNGFNLVTDKIYQCIFTVTSDMGYNPKTDTGSGGDVLTEVYVVATSMDEMAMEEYGASQLQVWYFNPEVIIDISLVPADTELAFPAREGMSQTVYSYNTMLIKNSAEGGVDLFVWLAGQNLEAVTPYAQCPATNVLDINNVEFRCKIGTLFQQDWRDVPHWDDSLACPTKDLQFTCQGAVPLVKINDGTFPFGLLANGHTAECWFRLNYPTPCVGEFSNEQSIMLFARAI